MTLACPTGGGPIAGCAIQANCDAGDVAVGGGFMVDPEGTRWSIDESFPVQSPPATATGWAVDAKLDVTAVNDPVTAQSCLELSGSAGSCKLTAAVICADLTPTVTPTSVETTATSAESTEPLPVPERQRSFRR